MSKRRSTDGGVLDMFLPSKRLAVDGCTNACGSGNAYASGSQMYQADAFFGQPSTSTLAAAHDGTLEMWLAVAAQVQDALAALPGWIQVAQAAQFDQPEHLSSLSSASTPLPVQNQGSGADCGSWPMQPSAAARPERSSDFYSSHESGLQQQQQHHPVGGSSPAAAATPAVAVVAPLAAADLPAQPAGAASVAPDSCASDRSDSAAASCGWFSKCRGCCQLTAGEVELQGQVVPLCRGCASSLHRRPSAEREHAVHRIMRAHTALCQREAAAVAVAGAGAGSS